ncbi:hypothetical protein BOX15_Mlig033471g2 [Macrostomum lignano]|uniref:SH3 domain-containing protein n=1 Tax=Macrostomum lignano TaxID=282301 RepID=A0A267DJX5_9PLAT|nr:hypothetical protein BOX15_Mlig033471g2 [Macrostomum lignano]
MPRRGGGILLAHSAAAAATAASRHPEVAPLRAALAAPSGAAQHRGFCGHFEKIETGSESARPAGGPDSSAQCPELVHCLFVPLVLIVQSIGPDLPSRVLSPLLTPAAVALLKHCLTSKECELWYSLGNAWTCHRQRWIDEHQQQAGDVPPYRPRFKRDGWQPELEPELLGQGLSKSQAAAPMVNGGAAPRQQPVIKINPVTMAQPHSPYSRGGNNGPKVQPSQPQRPVAQVAPRGPQLAQPSIYAQPRQSSFGVGHRQAARRSFNGAGFGAASSWDERQERLRSEAESRGRRVVQVLHDKAGRNAKELTVQRGELLEVLDDSRNWWQLRNYIGEVGHVPYTILRLL